MANRHRTPDCRTTGARDARGRARTQEWRCALASDEALAIDPTSLPRGNDQMRLAAGRRLYFDLGEADGAERAGDLLRAAKREHRRV